MNTEMPKHLPELPEGYVYLGRGDDLDAYRNSGDTLVCSEVKGRWFPTSLIYRWATLSHYAAPVDSDLGRKILSERGSTKVGKLHLEIDANDYARILREVTDQIDDLLSESDEPDLIIPDEVARKLRGTLDLSELTATGYRLELDSDGIRGWKE